MRETTQHSLTLPATSRRAQKHGFTLIELLVTLAILATLATLVVPLAQVQAQRGKEQQLRIALREIRTAIDAYKKAGDEGRIRRDAASTGYPKELGLLVEGVDDQRDPQRRKLYFLRQIPRDPFHEDPATPDAVITALVQLAQSMGDYDRMAIGFPSVVEQGVTRGAINLHSDWDGFPLAKVLQERLGKPLRIANDADVQGCGAIANCLG